MRVAVPKETRPGERRVALVPDVARRLKDVGFEVGVEAGAGRAACFDDDVYREAGVEVEADRRTLLGEADVVLRVQPPPLEEVAWLKAGSVAIGFLQPAAEPAVVEALATQGVSAFSLELLPRISRAQSMDALSSQASLAGYKAVLMAANRLGKYFPMLMTAAGTIPPARVLVLGAGVAGLQAIATARRLGAVVEAYDVRPAVREEVRSLGATFLELELESQEGEGGYAREQTEEFLRKQRELLTDRVAAADVVITTASVPGRRAPVLVTAAMVSGMRPGSVLVDLAAETGGNCELTEPGRVVEAGGVWIDGTTNVPSTVPVHASQLYARNVVNLLLHLAADGEVRVNLEDEITRGCLVTHAGRIVNERARQMMEGARAST
ncbi:MAG TPA: Re/Si-specific NAD(P)(+) transhydrogenase subunit alpha [Candidatus Dormibacteraeota bacterium]|nr:Re/Si-specific NAD(P)(+) transhydrogenase subunit alpha [Candidatus Dormibacteraeota bacterium]